MVRRPNRMLSITGLSRSHHEAIGRVASEWADLMQTIDQAIWSMLGLESSIPGRIVTQHLSDAVKIQMLEALADSYYDRTEIKECTKLLGVTDQLRVERNKVVHGEWRKDEGEIQPTRFDWSARRKLKLHKQNMASREIQKVANDIIDHHHDLFSFFYRGAVWRLASPAKPS